MYKLRPATCRQAIRRDVTLLTQPEVQEQFREMVHRKLSQEHRQDSTLTATQRHQLIKRVLKATADAVLPRAPLKTKPKRRRRRRRRKTEQRLAQKLNRLSICMFTRFYSNSIKLNQVSTGHASHKISYISTLTFSK